MGFQLFVRVVILFSLQVSSTQQITCGWRHPRAGTVRDSLYLDGGQYYFNTWAGTAWSPPGSPQYDSNTGVGQLLRLNYSMPFKSDSATPINVTDKMVILPLTGAGAYDAPSYADGAMFTDSYELYTFGGLPLTSVKDGSKILNYQLWPWDGQTIFHPGPSTFYPIPSNISNYITHGASVSIPTENLAFYFSGAHAVGYNPISISATPGDPDAATQLANTMLKVDMGSPGAARWTSLPLQSNVEPRAAGQLVWVPVSTKGILLAIGGVTTPMDLNNYDSSLNSTANASFTTSIPVFDVNSETWNVQSASSTASPGQLGDFCAVVAQASEKQFDIFIYGGNNDALGLTTDDTAAVAAQDAVWVLSVPEFVWTRVSTGVANHGRSGHVCSTPYPNQMLVVGGINMLDPGYCITDGTLLDIFDMNNLQWKHNYQPAVGVTYQRNSTISISIASQTSNENAAVSSLFAIPYPKTIKPYWPYKAQSNSDHHTSSTPIGAIIGGVVGGLALFTVLFLVWFCWPSRRRARKEKSRPQSEAGTGTTAHSNHVGRWIDDVSDQPLEAKPFDIISDTATEVDESRSPPIGTAEVFGDTYFSPVRRTTDGNRATNRYSTSLGHSPIPPRSPRSMHSLSVEADGEQVHELHNESRNSKVSSELHQAGHTFRNHPMYPHSIDGHLSNRTGPSDMSPASQPTDRLGATSPGPVPSELSEHGDTDTCLTTSGSEPGDTARVVSLTRPGHARNLSSISSGIPITPPAATDDYSRNSEMAQQRNSGVVSPLMQQEAQRPAHRRHGSSLSEMLLTPAGEPAGPREGDEDAERTLVNSPTSPNSNISRRKPLQSAYEATRRGMQ